VYDWETGFYYLQSRYYDPEVGRFISADVLLSTDQGVIGNNTFAYCGDNPVNRIDSEGQFWNFVIGAVVGAVIGGVTAALSGGDATEIIVGTLAGAASGLLAASGIGLIGQVAISAGIAGVSNAATQGIHIATGKQEEFDFVDLAVDVGIGALAGAIGGKGMGKSTNIQTLNNNLTKKVTPVLKELKHLNFGKAKSLAKSILKPAIKYYVSQTKHVYSKILLKSIDEAGGASFIAKKLISIVREAIDSRQ
jgi:RHS repeat-associated protein